MVGYHRLAEVVVVRQMATLTRTVAHRSLVVTHVVFHAHKCALKVSFRITNRSVACTARTDSRNFNLH